MSSPDERFDGMFMQLAQQVRGIDPLLEHVFSFMRRKTDFFAGPPGSTGDEATAKAVAKVLECVNKQAAIAARERGEKEAKELKRKQERARKDALKQKKQVEEEAKKRKAAGEEGVVEMGDDGFDVSAAEPAGPPAPAPAAAPAPPKPPAPPAAEQEKGEAEQEKGEDDEEDDGTPPPAGNGGTVAGKYVWTQTLQELNVAVAVPAGTKGRDLDVVIGKSKIRVGMRGEPPVFEGKLCKSVVVD
ncbi:hypothetical protein TeGR_g11615, partial [Tetraparma gracilis]